MRTVLVTGWAVLIAGTAGLGYAQEAPSPARPARVAIIEFGRIVNESVLGKSLQSRLEALQKAFDAETAKKQAELDKVDQAIRTLQEQLRKDTASGAPDASDRLRAELVRKNRDRQALLEDGQAELQRMRARNDQEASRIQEEFQAKVRPYIEASAKAKGFDIVVNGQWAHFVGAAVDLTPDVIARLNQGEKAEGAPERPAKTQGNSTQSKPRRP